MIEEVNITNADNTSSELAGGIPVSGDQDPIKRAREAVFKQLNTNKITFEEFNESLNDPEYADRIIESLASKKELKDWGLEKLKVELLGKRNEVSPQGSESTSAISDQPLEESAEPLQPGQNTNPQPAIPEGFRDAGNGLVLPEVKRQGTWRESFQGDFEYDIEGHEMFRPTEKDIADVGGWDNMVRFFKNEQPNVIVYKPNSAESVGDGVDMGGSYINFETAKPAFDVNALNKQLQLEQKPFEEWQPDDKMDYFLTKMIQTNKENGVLVKSEEELQNESIIAEATSDRESATTSSQAATLASNAFQSFLRGSARLGSDVLGIPRFLNDVIANAIGAPNFEQTYGKTFLDSAQEYLDGAITRDELYNRVRFGEEDIIDSFESGNISDGINKLVSATAESLPIMLSLSSGNVAGLGTTLSMGSGQYSNLLENNKDMDPTMKLINATLNMYAEMIPEKIGADAVFKPFFDLYKKSGAKVAEDALSTFLRKFGAKFGVLTPAAVEGTTEGATAVMQNIIAKYSGEDPNRKINQGLGNAILVGTFSGNVISAPAQITNTIVDKKARKALEGVVAENTDIEIALNDKELPEDVRSTLAERFQSNTQKINAEIERQLDKKGSLSSRSKEILADLEAGRERVNKLIGDENIPESVKQNAQVEVDQINEQIDEILNKEETNESDRVPAEPAVENVEVPSEQVPEQSSEQPEELVEESTPVEESPEVQEVATELSEESFFDRLRSAESRASRLAELKDSLSSYKDILLSDNSGIANDPKQKAKEDVKFLRDLTEYAILSIADGTIKTADAFKNLAREVADFGDEVLNKAYYAAKEVANNYVTTTKASSDKATADILTKMQDVAVDRTAPTTKVTSKDVKNLTDGGTKGTVTKTIKQANKDYYAAMQKGAKIGDKAAKDARKTHQQNVKKTLTDYYKNSKLPLTKVMTDAELSRISNKVAMSNNEKDVDAILEVLDKITAKAENAKKLQDFAKTVKKAKSRGKSQALPANVRDTFRELGRLDPVEVFRVLDDADFEFLASISNSFDATVKAGASKRNPVMMTPMLLDKIAEVQAKVDKARFERQLPKIMEHLKELHKDAKVSYNHNKKPKDFVEYQLMVEDLESRSYEEKPVKGKSESRKTNEEFILNNIEDLNEVELDEYTPDEVNAINSLKALTPEIMDRLSDADLVKLAIGLPNLYSNGRLDGIGSVAAKIKAHELSMKDSFVQPVSKALLEIPALGRPMLKLFGKGFEKAARIVMSTSQRMDTLFKDMFTKGKFMSEFGLQQYKEGRNKAERLYEAAQKSFGEMVKKDPDVKEFMRAKDRGKREAVLGIFAWMNQSESGLTDEQKQNLFERKKETLERMRDPNLISRFTYSQKPEMKNYLTNLANAIEEVSKYKTLQEFSDNLGKGERKVYENSVEMFNNLRPEFLANARLYNNVDLDTNIENYTPIDYTFFNDLANDKLLETSYDRSFSSAKISGRSGSKSAKDRIIKDGTMPKDGILDFNFITNTFKNYGLQLADIHTQGARMQIHHNLANNYLKDAINGTSLFDTMNKMMTEEMLGDYQYFNSPKAMNLSRKLMRALMDSVYGRALGGWGQAIKQFVPMITDGLVRTGEVGMIPFYFQNREAIGKFLADQDIARRGVQSSQMGSSVANELELGNIATQGARTTDAVLDWHDKVVNKVVLAPLRLGDVEAAKMSWMMYYKQYADKNGIDFNLDSKPNPEAAAYADNMVDIAGNTSVDSKKAKFTQSAYAKILFPFSGASFTSLVNMGVHTSKLVTALQMRDAESARQAARGMIANNMAIITFQAVGYGLRYASYYGLDMLASMATDSVDLDDDDEEEKLKEKLDKLVDDYKDKRIQRNWENSWYYLTNDLIHRGLLSQGVTEPMADAVIKPVYQKLTGFTISSYKSKNEADAVFTSMGIYGIAPAGFYSMFTKNSTLFDSQEDALKKEGYGSFLTAEGEVDYELPDGSKMPKSLRNFTKAMQILSIPAALGIQDQFTSSITRTAPSLYKKMEALMYKEVPKIDPKTLSTKFKNKFKELNYEGKSLKLEGDEVDLFMKYYKEAYNSSYKDLVKEYEGILEKGPEMEQALGKIIFREAKEKLMEDSKFRELWDIKATKKK